MSAPPPRLRAAAALLGAVLLGAVLLVAPCRAQTVSATTQPTYGTNINLGLPVYGGYAGYGGYGLSSYGGYPPSPYGNNNQAVQTIASPPPGSQPAQPGQSQLPSMTGGGGGGGSNNGAVPQAGGSAPPDASYELMRDPRSPVYHRYEGVKPETSELRPQVLAQHARGEGIRQGFLDENARLVAALDGEATRLDARYDFRRMMIGANLVPPVIGELKDVKQLGSSRLLYLTLGAYQIVVQARLVLSPPDWRDYLDLAPSDHRAIQPALKPDGGDEQKIYDASYAEGVAVGVGEARASFEEDLDRLERDYVGMQLYHHLAAQGALSVPTLARSRQAVRVAADGRRAFVGEQIVTLEVSPRFRAALPKAYR